MQKLEINPPEGYEIDQEKSDLSKGIVHFKEVKKNLTYEDVAKKLFLNNFAHYLKIHGDIMYKNVGDGYKDPDNSTTREQLESILALNKLCNVAKYLNGDWKPAFNNHSQNKLYIYITGNDIKLDRHVYSCVGATYFKSKELAQQAIDILGEEEIRKALTLNH